MKEKIAITYAIVFLGTLLLPFFFYGLRWVPMTMLTVGTVWALYEVWTS